MENRSSMTSNSSINNLVEQADENDNRRPSKWSMLCLKLNVTIEPALCAFFLAANLCNFVIANLIMDRVCEVELKLNKSECSLLGSDTAEGHRVEALVQPYATVILTGNSIISAIIPAIMSLFLGPWSDYNGRKILLLTPMLGMAVTYFVYAAFSYFTSVRAAYFLFAGLPFSICGGYINFISATYSYISDITTDENRALRLGLLEASLYIGILIGVTCNYKVFSIDKQYGYIITLCISALISLISFLYTLWFVPESVRHVEVPNDSGRLFQLKFVKEIFATSFKARENHGRILIILSLMIMTSTIIAMMGEGSLVYLFTRMQFGWDLQQFTNWVSVQTAISFFDLLLCSVILTKYLKVPDIVMCLICFLMKSAQCVMYGLIPSTSPNMMYFAQLFGLFGAFTGPGMRSVVSKTVPKEDIGKVFFLATSSESLFPLALSPLYTVLYNSTMNYFPGAFFLLSASLHLGNFIMCCVIYLIQRRASRGNYGLMAED